MRHARVDDVAAFQCPYVVFHAFPLRVAAGEDDTAASVFVGAQVLELEAYALADTADDGDVLDRCIPQAVDAFLARDDAGVFAQIDVQVVLAVAQYAAAFENFA